jgi:hypothetical protein
MLLPQECKQQVLRRQVALTETPCLFLSMVEYSPAPAPLVVAT